MDPENLREAVVSQSRDYSKRQNSKYRDLTVRGRKVMRRGKTEEDADNFSTDKRSDVCRIASRKQARGVGTAIVRPAKVLV